MGTPGRRKRRDFAEIAFDVVQQATTPDDTPVPEEPPKTRRARKAGKAGGRARAKTLSPERRRQIARKAAASRWAHQKESEQA